MDKELMAVATQLTGELLRNRSAGDDPLDEQTVADLFLVAYRGIKLAGQLIDLEERQEAQQAARDAEVAAAHAEAQASAAWVAAGGVLDAEKTAD